MNRFLEEGGMAFMSHVSERFGRTGLSLKHQISDELDIHPGWWIPSLAACLLWTLLAKREPRAQQ